ncbi:MAG: hypothetical protein NUK62_01200 [Tenericutes bacterium]|nr:hypothetical protein [Mycoplasmatota bacterium]
MTIKKFRTFDLIVLATAAIITDVLLALFGLIGIRLYLAISYPIIILCYIRWRKYGIYSHLAVVLAHFILYGLYLDVGWLIALAHILALMMFAFILPLLKTKTFDKKRVEMKYNILLYLGIYLIVFFAEWILFAVFGFGLNLINHALNHSLNILLGLGLIMIMAYQKDLMVNMHQYLLEKDEEK